MKQTVKRTVTLASLDWAGLVGQGTQVVASHMTSEPVQLLRALAAASPHDGDFRVFLGVPFTDAGLAFSPRTVLTVHGGIGGAGALGAKRPVRRLSTSYGASGSLFTTGQEAADVVLVALARDRHGQLTLGAAHGHVLDAARVARTVIAEINARAPAVPGAPWPDDIAIDALVEVDYPLAIAPDQRSSPLELAIATQVAALVAEGACLQLGIGALPSAVLTLLEGHRGLGIHSGMLTPALHRLMTCGAVDNSRKSVDAGTTVAGSVYGDDALYRAVHEAPGVRLREPGHTHAPSVIASLDDFTAINSAIEVDLLGQINAETVTSADGSRRYVGGVGGLNDFVRAARQARRGKAIVALPSRQAGKAGSTTFTPRIVATLSGPATVSACDADIVVTEQGAAHLRDASIDERAQRLIAIAHPAEREALQSAARKLGFAV